MCSNSQNGCLSPSDVKDLAEEVISPLPLPGVEGSLLNPGDIWLVVLACVNETSIWETCKDTDGTPCDDTVFTWLHTLNREWLEFVGDPHVEEGELCSMAPKDGTTTCHRYCTAYVVSARPPRRVHVQDVL